MVPLEILPIVSLVANGIIGNQITLSVSRQPIVTLMTMLPLVETLVPMVPLVVPMVHLTYFCILFYVYISVVLLFANITLIKTVLFCEIYKFQV